MGFSSALSSHITKGTMNIIGIPQAAPKNPKNKDTYLNKRVTVNIKAV